MPLRGDQRLHRRPAWPGAKGAAAAPARGQDLDRRAGRADGGEARDAAGLGAPLPQAGTRGLDGQGEAAPWSAGAHARAGRAGLPVATRSARALTRPHHHDGRADGAARPRSAATLDASSGAAGRRLEPAGLPRARYSGPRPPGGGSAQRLVAKRHARGPLAARPRAARQDAARLPLRFSRRSFALAAPRSLQLQGRPAGARAGFSALFAEIRRPRTRLLR